MFPSGILDGWQELQICPFRHFYKHFASLKVFQHLIFKYWILNTWRTWNEEFPTLKFRCVVQISLAAELCFLDSPHRLILSDELVLAGPGGKQNHSSGLMVISWEVQRCQSSGCWNICIINGLNSTVISTMSLIILPSKWLWLLLLI